MKFLLVLVVVLIGFWAWRSSRGDARARQMPAQPPKDPSKAIEMRVCDLCGVHCPKSDLVLGNRGAYCSEQHRKQAEP